VSDNILDVSHGCFSAPDQSPPGALRRSLLYLLGKDRLPLVCAACARRTWWALEDVEPSFAREKQKAMSLNLTLEYEQVQMMMYR